MYSYSLAYEGQNEQDKWFDDLNPSSSDAPGERRKQIVPYRNRSITWSGQTTLLNLQLSKTRHQLTTDQLLSV